MYVYTILGARTHTTHPQDDLDLNDDDDDEEEEKPNAKKAGRRFAAGYNANNP